MSFVDEDVDHRLIKGIDKHLTAIPLVHMKDKLERNCITLLQYHYYYARLLCKYLCKLL